MDPERLAELLQMYRPYLRLVAEQSLGADVRRREDASDVLQRTEFDVTQSIADFRGATEPEFSAWVKCILRRNIASVHRTHRAAKRDIAREFSMADADVSASISWMTPAANSPSPSRRMMRGEAALALAAALEELPDGQRAAVRMRHLEGMKIDDVALKLGVTAGSAAGLIRRGVAKLRELLSEEAI